MEDDLLTITEAARTLGVSKDTIRRRIKKGELTAEKMNGPFGRAYYINSSDLFPAQAVTDVVKVERTLTRMQVREDIEKGVTGAIQPFFEQLQEQNEKQLQELQELKDRLDKLEGKDRRPWWKRWFSM